jgi:hypothetical protein
MAFRFAVMQANGEPFDPAVFLCVEPQWRTGERGRARP